MAPLLIIASDSQPFDQIIISHWQEEGYKVRFELVREDSRYALRSIESAGDSLGGRNNFAIIAYGSAATTILRHAFIDPIPRLCALVAFYPPSLPDPTATPPKGLRVQVHLAGTQPFAPKYSSYSYVGASPGFAQHGNNNYHKIASNLAWSRTLDCVRKGFGIEVDLETIWEEHLALEFSTKNASATMATMVPYPAVNHVPTLTGGISAPHVLRFYRDFFIPCNPPSLTSTLLSRTIGANRIVDEMLISFTHTCEMPWMLPGVPATGKKVEIVVVGVIGIRGGKLERENIYWDQASVLVQVGLLDPKLGAVGLGKNGVSRLPVYGAETAKKVVDDDSVASNALIEKW